MKILLVDDEQLQLTRLESEAKKVLPDDTEYLIYLNPLQALKENENGKIDIAFLDIEMPGINGIELAKELKKINPLINVIFVTAYDNYALEAYRLHASGYLSKPVSSERIKEELEALRHPIDFKGSKKIQVKCFGNFEVFIDGQPLKFQRSKSKELFAYLVDREGATANINELNAVLWEEDHKSYLRNLIADIQQTLKEAGMSEVFIKRHNECCNDPSLHAPKKMREAILELLKDNPPKEDIDLFASIYRSQAICYQKAIEELEKITHQRYSSIYVIGGGAKNKYLNHLIEEITKKKVIALPIEATALGNIKVQMKASQEL